jgi:hypothetical protein
VQTAPTGLLVAINEGAATFNTLQLGVTPVTAGVTWSILNPVTPPIATIDQTGLLTIFLTGSVTVEAASPTTATVTHVATVTAPIAINQTVATYGMLLSVTGKTPDLSTAVSWQSLTPAIANIDANGTVKTYASGTATFVASSKTYAGVMASQAVVVTAPTLSIQQTQGKHANVVQLSATSDTAPFPNTVTWLSLTPSVATVNASSGLVTFSKSGTAQVRATSTVLTTITAVTTVSTGTVPQASGGGSKKKSWKLTAWIIIVCILLGSVIIGAVLVFKKPAGVTAPAAVVPKLAVKP